MIAIRRFVCEDAETVRQILYPDMEISRVSEMVDEWNSGFYQGRRFETFAILSDGRIVGYVSLYEHGRQIASLGAEVIAEERGKGAAFEALSLLMQYASENGYRIILDQVREDNPASIRLHRKLGFESDGYVYRNQRDHRVILYLKAI